MRPKWYAAKKMAICPIALFTLVVAMKLLVVGGERSLGQWFGPN
jgi:hypothetical protein